MRGLVSRLAEAMRWLTGLLPGPRRTLRPALAVSLAHPPVRRSAPR